MLQTEVHNVGLEMLRTRLLIEIAVLWPVQCGQKNYRSDLRAMKYDLRLECTNRSTSPGIQANLLDPNRSDSPAESAMILLLDESSKRRPDRAISLEWSHMASSFFDFGCVVSWFFACIRNRDSGRFFLYKPGDVSEGGR